MESENVTTNKTIKLYPLVITLLIVILFLLILSCYCVISNQCNNPLFFRYTRHSNNGSALSVALEQH